MMKSFIIEAMISKFEQEYIDFMGINKFPSYKLEYYELKREITDDVGFGAMAQALYDLKKNEHILRICNNIELTRYVVFHEFTHILDTQMYAKAKPDRYVYLSGYTEYHASQVELMSLLKTQEVAPEEFSFSVKSIIDTYPNKLSVEEYLKSKHQFVVEMMQKKDFPINFEILTTTLGVLYNYFGLRSVCKLYSYDYNENVDNSDIIQYIPLQLFLEMNCFMDGWFDENKIEMSFGLYQNTLMPLIKEYKLL